jgi:hypothetical protein
MAKTDVKGVTAGAACRRSGESQIPTTLQGALLGKEIQKAPPNNVSHKSFFRFRLFQGRADSKSKQRKAGTNVHGKSSKLDVSTKDIKLTAKGMEQTSISTSGAAVASSASEPNKKVRIILLCLFPDVIER